MNLTDNNFKYNLKDFSNYLRDPNKVMRLERIGAFHQCRLSFIRHLLRKLKKDNWQYSRPLWNIDNNGFGHATYSLTGPKRIYTLIVFSHKLDPSKRSDRVIAEAWDASFTLFDGEPTQKDILRLSKNIPLQESGRVSEKELVLSRANRSVRLFDYVIKALSEGKQPEINFIESIGYLMRTTAVYGSGKFGAADREKWSDREEFSGSFQPELMSVWLIRSFTLDLVEHIARSKSPKTAITINKNVRHHFGVGNSTGLGMAPFLINHPLLINSWINARETALARVRSIKNINKDKLYKFNDLLKRSEFLTLNWKTSNETQTKKIEQLKLDLKKLSQFISKNNYRNDFSWNILYLWAEKNLSFEGQEQLVSLIIDTYGEEVDDLAHTMSANDSTYFKIDGSMTLEKINNLINKNYSWALSMDFKKPESRARVWYISQEKLEPRLGERFEEPIEDYEQPLAPGFDLYLAYKDLTNWSMKKTISEFLIKHPEHRQVIRRIQMCSAHPYAEIQDNTIDSKMLPIDLLRCKLSFFGATKFDPRSDRWVRITLFQGMPFPNEFHDIDSDDMAYPTLNKQ